VLRAVEGSFIVAEHVFVSSSSVVARLWAKVSVLPVPAVFAVRVAGFGGRWRSIVWREGVG
jgi:hypothetical protein